ncbi:MAG TPA: hypothetical protein VF510_07945 [Ktedonobacterales bacterium]
MNGGHSSGNIWWRFSAAVFRWLLRLYPRQFRDAYSSQMMQDFRDLWEETALRSGVIGVWRLCWDTLGDLVATAIAERLGKDQAVGRSIIMRVSAVVVWATAVYAALSVQSINLPLPIEVWRFLSWGELTFNVVFLAGLVGLQLKYRQRTSWYIWLIGSGTALTFFCWRPLPMLLTQWVYLKSGIEGLESISYIAWQTRHVFFAIYLVYSVGMLAWGVGALAKDVLPPWTAVLLMLFGLDSLLRWPVIPNEGPLFVQFARGFNVWAQPIVAFGTPYIFVRCLLLAGLGYALWVDNRPERASAEQNGVGSTPQRFAEGVGPAV